MAERILLIDNNCSTLDLFVDMLKCYEVSCIHWTSCAELSADTILDEGFALVVLSPGRPTNVENNEHELAIIKTAPIPLIGVCYGFQLIAHAYGGQIEPLAEARFGSVRIQWAGTEDIFKGLPDFNAFGEHRYALKHLPSWLSAVARSIDGYEIIRAKDRPVYGIQFHPELEGHTFAGAQRTFDLMVQRLVVYSGISTV